jgi:hypothetical protein
MSAHCPICETGAGHVHAPDADACLWHPGPPAWWRAKHAATLKAGIRHQPHRRREVSRQVSPALRNAPQSPEEGLQHADR